MRLFIALAVVVTGLLAAPAAQPESIEVTFEGQVSDPDGRLVAEAEVFVVGEELEERARTDADGRFSIRARVKPGRFEVRARSERFRGVRELLVEPGHKGATIDASVQMRRGETAMPGPPPPPSPPERPEDGTVVTVYYATHRAREAGPVLAFANDRNDTGRLELGHFEVSIPRDHRLAHVERPTWRTMWREDPARHFVILSRHLDSYDGFYARISGEVTASRRREVLVFIHGFNVAFDDAIYRTAQVAYDLGFDGPPILYSWPSNGNLQSYFHDATSNEATIPHLRWFLEDVVRRSGATTVHVLAHSMGNRALTHALSRMADGGRRLPGVSQVILTAPDIDADVFRDLSASMRRSASKVTLYASSADLALAASKKANGFRRAGDAEPLTIVPGVDTVDASLLTTDFLSHSYYGDHASVIGDIRCLIGGSPPERRYGLARLRNAGNVFWRFVKEPAQMICLSSNACACGLPDR
jgi:esterase/lipase superfamily enzyme